MVGAALGAARPRVEGDRLTVASPTDAAFAQEGRGNRELCRGASAGYRPPVGVAFELAAAPPAGAASSTRTSCSSG